MNKNYKPINSTFREHFKIHGHLSSTMIEELLDEYEDNQRKLDGIENDLIEGDNEVVYWQKKYAAIT